jgi:hypothetical protein
MRNKRGLAEHGMNCLIRPACSVRSQGEIARVSTARLLAEEPGRCPSGELDGYKIGYSHPKTARPPIRWAAYKCFIVFWCGREDLNLHEIAPASTSRYLTGFHWVPPCCPFMSLRRLGYHRVSLSFTNTVAKPLQFLYLDCCGICKTDRHPLPSNLVEDLNIGTLVTRSFNRRLLLTKPSASSPMCDLFSQFWPVFELIGMPAKLGTTAENR